MYVRGEEFIIRESRSGTPPTAKYFYCDQCRDYFTRFEDSFLLGGMIRKKKKKKEVINWKNLSLSGY